MSLARQRFAGGGWKCTVAQPSNQTQLKKFPRQIGEYRKAVAICHWRMVPSPAWWHHGVTGAQSHKDRHARVKSRL